MPWRGIFVVALGLMTGGCILSAYQVASWTATGVSYMFSGKGLGDHALSLATSKDCATLRIFEGKEICTDYGSDFENAWAALASSWQVPEILREPVAVASAGESAANSSDDISGFNPGIPANAPVPETLVGQATAMTVRLDGVKRGKEMRRTGLDFAGLVAPDVDESRTVTPWLAAGASKKGLDLAGLTPEGVSVAHTIRKRMAAPPTEGTISANSRKSGPAAIYLVLGSFKNHDNARALSAQLVDGKASVMKMLSDGRTVFRVLAGPIEAEALSQARISFAKAGIRNAWAVKLCRGSFETPPCEPVLQQAALPKR